MAETQRGRICVSIGRKSIESALAAAREAATAADVIEIRLDTLEKPAITPFTATLEKQLLFTYRPVWEGGFYDGDEADRMALLKEAIAEGAAFIDLELLAPDDSFEIISAARKNTNTQLIVSNHNFELTPSREHLLQVLQSMQDRGADIGKIITTAHDYRDVLRVLQLQVDAAVIGLPLIAFCMGRAGVISRLATIELAGYMTYCAANESEATAPGQISVKVMRDMQKSLSLG